MFRTARELDENDPVVDEIVEFGDTRLFDKMSRKFKRTGATLRRATRRGATEGTFWFSDTHTTSSPHRRHVQQPRDATESSIAVNSISNHAKFKNGLQYSIGRKERWLLLEEIIESNLCVAHIDCGEHERAVNDPRHAHTNRALLPQRKSRKQSQKQKATQAQNARKNVFLVRRGRKGVTRFERRAPGKKVASNLKPQIHRDLFNLHQPKHVFVWLPELQRRADRNRIPVRRSMSTYCPFRGRNSALRTYRKSEIVRQMNQGFDVRARVLLANPGMLDRQTVQRFAL